MKILTIIGSPRKKGNSLQAAKNLEEKLTAQGEYDFEYIFLKDTHIEECKGCFNCVSRGIEFCPLKDDIKMIQEKMEESDGLLMITPVYVMNVSALLKNFIDRLAYLCHRPEYHGKKAIVMCTTGGIGIKETLKYMKMILKSWGYDVTSECGIITAPWPPTRAMHKKNNKNMEKSAKKFDKTLKTIKKNQNDDSKISFYDYIGFKIFKTISENVREYMPADYQFYKNKEYYHPAKIGILTRFATSLMLPVIFFLMRDQGPADNKK